VIRGGFKRGIPDIRLPAKSLRSVLSARAAVPAIPVAAALPSSHLTAFRPPTRIVLRDIGARG